MKRILLFIAVLLTAVILQAQNCDYYFLQEGKTIEIGFKNKKGKSTGRQVYSISKREKKGNSVSATVSSEMFSAKGKSEMKSENRVSCENGKLVCDMRMYVPAGQQEYLGNSTAKVDEAYLEYPASMKKDDQLKDGRFSVNFKTETGLTGSLSVSITNRKVLDKETVTTPAGTWECFKISCTTKVNTKILLNVPVTINVTEWFAPGFGIVKTEAGSSTTEIIAIR
ncbi:MAG: DUF3108 domain-containing protein [Chitinophagaceae bacterium]|jgi:hypothetical protein|nr:DUF3108 domain-containing protein [Chitinophagaceae bacterium]